MGCGVAVQLAGTEALSAIPRRVGANHALLSVLFRTRRLRPAKGNTTLGGPAYAASAGSACANITLSLNARALLKSGPS